MQEVSKYFIFSTSVALEASWSTHIWRTQCDKYYSGIL